MARRLTLLLVALLVMAPAVSRAAEDQFFDSDGVKIRYVVEGQGEPVLLIHGFSANIDMQWGLPGIIRELAKDYKVIALDNRGHGKSGKPHDPKQYGEKMVEDSIRLLNHLKIDKAHIVGYSMGGFITNKLITVHPERAITATLGGAGWAQADDQRLAFLTDLADSLDAGKGIAPLIERLAPPDKPKPTAEQVAAINQMVMLLNDSKALAACIRGMTALAVPEEKLKANKVPTLALIGEIDPLKESVDELAPRMKNLKVVVIDGADHMNAFTNKAFVTELKDFLGSHQLAKPAAAAAAGSN